MMRMRACAAVAAAAVLSACNLAPTYTRPAAPVPQRWPSGAAYPAQAAEAPASLPWRTLITDAKLKTVIEQALANNRDLRAAVANVASVRAEYHIQRAEQFPTLAASAAASITRGSTSAASTATLDSYSADVGISSFEIDLFGRLKNLSKQAFEQYLSTEAGARATRITLIGETATAYVTFASDSDLLRVSRATLVSANRSLQLTESLHGAGLGSQVDVQEAETVVAQAQSDIESYTTQVAQDRNALELLVGALVDDALLPTSLDELDGGIGIVPAGLSSTVLLTRPDVLEAEHELIAANANIGAARAAFFPTITLTSAVGFASGALSSLFSHGAFYWSAAPSVSMPIFGGSTRGNLEYAKAQRDYYLADYEKAVQSAFEDVADALARRGTIERQRAAQRRLVAASEKSYQLADAQYRVGSDTYLNALTAQRTLYSARQTQISAVLADLSNRVALYQAIASDDAG
jgi:outer membrane protein, multidrug efflux system